MLHEVQHCYLKWCTEGFEPFKDEYRSHMAFRGTRATLEALDGSVFAQGTIAGIDDQGQLLLETAPGKLVAAQSGVSACTLIGTLVKCTSVRALMKRTSKCMFLR